MADVTQIKITHIKSVKHGTDAIKGVVGATIKISQTVKEGSSDGDPGISSQDKTFGEISGSLKFESEAPIVALLGLAEGNLVITAHKAGGTSDRTTTIKNVQYRGSGGDWPANNDNKLMQSSIDFKATWGADDTLATMITETDAA